LEEEKYILNILNVFLEQFNLPYEIKHKISTFLFYFSIPINLKILDILIKDNKKDVLNNFILINNNIKYITHIFSKINYNAIFLEKPYNYDFYEWAGVEYTKNNHMLKMNIIDYDIKKRNIIILTDCISPDYDDKLLQSILMDDKEIEEIKNKDIETCFNFNHGIVDINELENYYHYFNYKEDYTNFINKPLSPWQSAIHASTCWFCDRISIELMCGDKYEEPSIISFKDFLYLLIKFSFNYEDVNSAIILIFKNKSISFGTTYYNNGVTVIEVYNNGGITIPDYNFEQIKNMHQWNIYDIVKYNFLIEYKI
jgi:hypothetical protein